MDEFEKLLVAERVSVERFVRFRLNVKADCIRQNKISKQNIRITPKYRKENTL